MLTQKEIQVLKLKSKGFKQLEIAKKLKISQPAVSSFQRSINRKIHSSIKLIELLKELGIDLKHFKK